MGKACLPARVSFLTGAAILFLGLSTSAQAEEAAAPVPAPETATGGAASIYTPADFARFAPSNALDMIVQVPGFSIRGDDEGQRGLGQATTNVLINGERVASKSDGIYAQLQRIGADRVVRIELVDGGTLGIPGLSGQVANVITRADALSGRFSYNASFRPRYAKPNYLGGEVSLSGSSERFEWTLALANGTGRGGAGGGESLVYDGAGNLTEERDVLVRFVGDFPRLSGSAKWTSPGGTVIDANASYSRNYNRFDNDEARDLASGVDLFRDFTNRNRGWGYELGGTINLGIGPGRLKMIGLERYNFNRLRSVSVSSFADLRPPTGNRYTSDTATGEHIGRAEYAWPMLGGDWQVDAEAAFNRLDREAALFTLDAAGNFIETPFPSGSGGVTEDRYEAILTHNRALGSNLTFQVGGGAEFSTLAQAGANGLTRRFWRPKGSLALAWEPRSGLDISLEVARRVGQLSFGDFLSTVSLAQGNQNAGNTRLVPPQSWEAEIEATKLLGAWGSTTLRVFAQRVDDYLEIVPLPGGEETVGNIDRARIFGLNWTSTITLDQLGFRGAKLDVVVELEDTALKDPLTGLTRAWSGRANQSFDLNLRHDIPGSDWAWGLGLEYDHVLPFYRLNEIGREWEGPIYTSAFIEHKDVFGMTATLSVFNLTNGRARFERLVWDGYRDRSPRLFRETRNLAVTPIIGFGLKGDF